MNNLFHRKVLNERYYWVINSNIKRCHLERKLSQSTRRTPGKKLHEVLKKKLQAMLDALAMVPSK